MTHARIAEIEARLSAATPGKWTFSVSLLREARIWIESWDGALYLRADKGTDVSDWKMAENASLIAHAPTDLALLLRLVEHYEQALRENVNDISEDPSARIWAKTLLSEAAKLMAGES